MARLHRPLTMPSPKSKAPKAKLPKAAVPRVMYANTYKWRDQPITIHLSHGHATKMRGWPHTGTFPVLVLPCANLQSARARLRWERLSESEKIEALRELLKRTWNQTHEATARAILSLQSSPAKGGREK